MSTSKLALRPYLEKIEQLCQPLSREEMVEIILGLAREKKVDQRSEFLDNLLGLLPRVERAAPSNTASSHATLLGRIEGLRESILERIDAIEDGSYWDDLDEDMDGYSSYDEEPDLLGEEHKEDLEECFAEADDLFMQGLAAEALEVYAVLLDLINEIEKHSYHLEFQVDLREARARYCRCVYDQAPADGRVARMLTAMQTDIGGQNFAGIRLRDLPLLQDVVNAQTGELAGFAAFLSDWAASLAKRDFTLDRVADLRLEAAFMAAGLDAVRELARSWQAGQPKGYLFWLKQLEDNKDWPALRDAAREALAALEAGGARERAGEYLVTAGRNLPDAGIVLEGKRERFRARICDDHLLELVVEAGRQQVRAPELASLQQLLQEKNQSDPDRKVLQAKVHLMAADLEQAHRLARDAKPVGWSHDSSAGLVFSSILYLVCGRQPGCTLIHRVLREYAGSSAIYSFTIRVPEADENSFFEEIKRGLDQISIPAADLAEYHQWAGNIGEKRVHRIVTDKHRNAYDRAARVLGAMAEARAAAGAPDKARQLLRAYYHEHFNRFAAFRKEVKAAVSYSQILRGLGGLW